jgi:hypothetical protein
MKKELSIIGLSMIPALAVAAGTAITSNTTVTAVACTLLQDDLKLQLSSGVVGAYDCNTTANAIRLSSCHTSGRVTQRTSKTVVNPSACTADPNDTAACASTTSSGTGAVVASTTTAGGQMSMKFGGSCDTGGSLAASVLPQ